MCVAVGAFGLTTKRGAGVANVDTHAHITFDGAMGDVLTVTWSVNVSAPAPAPAHRSMFNYTKLSGKICNGQCSAGTAGTSTEKTAAECTATCNKDSSCSCVVFSAGNGTCMRLEQCLTDDATHSTAYDTYVKDYTVIP